LYKPGEKQSLLTKDERSFAQNLLHVAAVAYDLLHSVSGSNIGPDFGKNLHKFAWGNRLVDNSYTWMWAIEHSGEDYDQLVAYYRANNLVPPDSRR
jgi:hypothetical protein